MTSGLVMKPQLVEEKSPPWDVTKPFGVRTRYSLGIIIYMYLYLSLVCSVSPSALLTARHRPSLSRLAVDCNNVISCFTSRWNKKNGCIVLYIMWIYLSAYLCAEKSIVAKHVVSFSRLTYWLNCLSVSPMTMPVRTTVLRHQASPPSLSGHHTLTVWVCSSH